MECFIQNRTLLVRRKACPADTKRCRGQKEFVVAYLDDRPTIACIRSWTGEWFSHFRAEGVIDMGQNPRVGVDLRPRKGYLKWLGYQCTKTPAWEERTDYIALVSRRWFKTQYDVFELRRTDRNHGRTCWMISYGDYFDSIGEICQTLRTDLDPQFLLQFIHEGA